MDNDHTADEDDNDDFKPSFGDTSSIILLNICVVSTLASLFVSYSIFKIGGQTASSKLILYLTLTQTNLNFAKTPFLFYGHKGCYLSGVLFFYSYTQIYLISYYMLVYTHSLLLQGNHFVADRDSQPTETRTRVMTASDYELSKTSKNIIFVVPLLALVFPMTSNVFEEKFNWCGINPDSQYGFLVFVQFLVVFSVVCCLTFYELYKIFSELRQTNTFSSELYYRVFKGPFLYASVSFIIILSCTIFVFTNVNGNDKDRSEYYHQYLIIIGMYIPGIFYFIIFLVEKNYIKNIEADFDEMNQFCKEFCDGEGDDEEVGVGRDGDNEVSFSFRLSNSIKSSLGGADGVQSSLRGLLLEEEEGHTVH